MHAGHSKNAVPRAEKVTKTEGSRYTKEMAAVAADRNQAGNLSALYSMESERKLHLEVFGGEECTAENQEIGELGDVVELF